MTDYINQKSSATRTAQVRKRTVDMIEVIRQSTPENRALSSRTLPKDAQTNTSIEVEPVTSSQTQSSSQHGSTDTIGANTELQKKRRGATKDSKGWGTGAKLICRSKHDQPLGVEGKQLNTQLGVYARNCSMFPLMITSWECMDQATLELVWKDIQANSNAPEGYKKIALRKIGILWRKWKSRVKKDYYKKYTTDEERIANVPPNVEDVEQWRTLVKYWGLEKVGEQSVTNTKNSTNMVAYTRTRRTPDANITPASVCSLTTFSEYEARFREEIEKLKNVFEERARLREERYREDIERLRAEMDMRFRAKVDMHWVELEARMLRMMQERFGGGASS